MARAALDLGFYISFSGILTFKKAQDLRDVAAFVPLDRMLIETDSPYLAPVPYRGKTNNPSYVPFVAQQIAQLRNMPRRGDRARPPATISRPCSAGPRHEKLLQETSFISLSLLHLLCAHAAIRRFLPGRPRDNAGGIKSLLSRGFDPNTLDRQGPDGTVHRDARASLKVIEVLIDLPKTNVDARNAEGRKPADDGRLKGQPELVTKLIARDADVNKPGWTPLHYAATSGQVAIMKLLLDKDAYIDAESPNGTTPLMMAAMYGSAAAVKLLLDEGADVAMRNQQGMTAVDFAERGKRPDAVQLLSAAGVPKRPADGKW